LATLMQLGLTARSRDSIKQVKPGGEEEEVIPGSMADLMRQGAFGMKVIPIDAALDVQQEEETDGNDGLV